FMLGDTIMVAPVLTRGARQRQVTFPAGTWSDDHGEVIVGPTVQAVDAPLGRLPWFQRVTA
ncbi:MAG: hypothetical protein ACRDT9_05085, partial [Agromyces sp.]